MISRRCQKELRELKRYQLQRYRKDRCRNLLAEPGPHEVALVLDGLKAGFNVPKIFRSAEAFGAAEVHLINIGPFDPAPAKGSFRSVPARFHDEFDTSYRDLVGHGYTLFTLEPAGDAVLTDAALPRRCAFVLGHEEYGISFDRSHFPAIRSLAIPQFGRVESLNVAVAASVALYEYVRQHGTPKPVPAGETELEDS